MRTMAPQTEQRTWIQEETNPTTSCLQKFRLYETRSNFYMIGRDKNRTFWRVLKINRLELSELDVLEDSTTYTETECCDLLKRIHEGNRSTGGLKFVTTCYGIVGFVKFLGPYYILIITKRRKIGIICGHPVYAITKSEMITIPSSTLHSNMANSRNEKRYKKLLSTVDLTKDFFFSYSYHVMLSLQKNLSNYKTGQSLYETMFVWNEFLTRGIRNLLNNTYWTVALVYGFFKQVKLAINGHHCKLTLIARRSRHYAGTRYLKRGVNDKGRVANDVETEQIVFEDVSDGCPIQISSVVQNRGSIPLFWSQETSRLNIKPDIILSKKDQNYQATKLHFENLTKRYDNPIIILNLIKTREKRPRESILRAEFANAIRLINKDLDEEDRLKFLHWDLNKYSRNKATNVLALLTKVAANALDLTGFFYCQVIPTFSGNDLSSLSFSENYQNDGNSKPILLDKQENAKNSESEVNGRSGDMGRNQCIRSLLFQKGVLRTNCIDCLDRTNVAQYAYGLVALTHQLQAVGVIDAANIDLDSPLADDLMRVYEAMGDTLALQYGGSAAHNKIFSERRGQWKAATQSQEFFRTIQRYYSNAYMDAEKQDGINIFLGHFQPQKGKPALWELDSDQHYNIGRRASDFTDENARSMIKRSLSDGNILCESNSPIDDLNIKQHNDTNPVKGILESTPVISTCESEISYSRYTPSMSCKQLFPDSHVDQYLQSGHICSRERCDSFNCSNFLDIDWLSSSGNSCEEETYERSAVINSPMANASSNCIANDITPTSSIYDSRLNLKAGETIKGRLWHSSSWSSDSPSRYSDTFVQWMTSETCFFP